MLFKICNASKIEKVLVSYLACKMQATEFNSTHCEPKNIKPICNQ